MDYIISGIDQKINNMGQKLLLNYDGAKRLTGQESTICLYVFAENGYNYSNISKKVVKYYPDVSISDSKKLADESLSVVALAMKTICVFFVIITLLVVFLVVFLLIKIKVVKERKNNGIYKAMGYTTVNLMVQTVMSNLPVITVGAVIGAVVSIFAANPVTVLILSFAGISKCSMVIEPKWLIVTVIGIFIAALFVAIYASARIRKVEPVKMLCEE